MVELAAFGGIALLAIGHQAGCGADAMGAWLNAHSHEWWLSIPALLPCYVLINATMILSNSALISCVLKQLDGGSPTMRDGLRAAWSIRGRILAWSLATGIVSTLIDQITQRLPDAAGQLVAALGGLAWSLATFFVVPFLVFERAGVVDAINASSSLIKRTWGEQARSASALARSAPSWWRWRSSWAAWPSRSASWSPRIIRRCRTS
jgi:hypothetical protein